MLRTLFRAAAAASLAAGAAVVLAAPAHALECVTADGEPLVCAGAGAWLDPDTSNGAVVSPSVDVDVCVYPLHTRVLCQPESTTVELAETGVVNGVGIGSEQVGGTPVHVPRVCLNSNPCAGPVDETLPTVDVVCVTSGHPVVLVDGQEHNLTGDLAGTC